MTTCFECNIDEPIDGHTLHNGRLLCSGCSSACPGAPTCEEMTMKPEPEMLPPMKVTLLDTSLPVTVEPVGQYFRVTSIGPMVLQPGDLVEVVEGRVTRVVEPAQTFWVTAFFPDGASYADVVAKAARWADAGIQCEVSTSRTVDIITADEDWLREGLRYDAELDWVDMCRTPVASFDLKAEVAKTWDEDTYQSEMDFDAWMNKRMEE